MNPVRRIIALPANGASATVPNRQTLPGNTTLTSPWIWIGNAEYISVSTLVVPDADTTVKLTYEPLQSSDGWTIDDQPVNPVPAAAVDILPAGTAATLASPWLVRIDPIDPTLTGWIRLKLQNETANAATAGAVTTTFLYGRGINVTVQVGG